ncbi:MAG: hypothetical protein JXA42_01330 [Anaerolineales bacterium]|nr:hypothetical protein [Anaerolineales bacterium]
MELIIDSYGLYGDDRLSPRVLEVNLGLQNVDRYMAWVFDRLRGGEARVALEEIARKVARKILERQTECG